MSNMYIRTKDNLYEITDKQYDILCGNLTEEEQENYKNITSFGIGSVEEGTYQSILIKDVLKYSENLEELCDMFVYCKRGFYEIYRQLDFAHYDKEYIKNGGTIKGAIWTEWGLKYVVQVNESGGLDLVQGIEEEK